MYLDVFNYDLFVCLIGDFKVLMGCCLFLLVWENENGEYVNVGRNNFGVVIFNILCIVI